MNNAKKKNVYSILFQHLKLPQISLRSAEDDPMIHGGRELYVDEKEFDGQSAITNGFPLNYHNSPSQVKYPQCITGWWFQPYPSEKYECVSWDDDIPINR